MNNEQMRNNIEQIMEELVSINLNIKSLDERQEVFRKELSTYDFNQIKWQLKIERELKEIEKILKNMDKSVTEKIDKFDEKFIREVGKMKSKMGDIQVDVKYLKEYPFIVESRLSLVEERQEELRTKVNIFETKKV